MAALQKFKLLATQCATARSPCSARPSSSPGSGSGSPGFRIRRRKTLRMLLGRWKSYSAVEPSDRSGKKGTLRDLLVSSPPLTPERCDAGGEHEIGYGGGIEETVRCEREADGVWRRLGIDLIAGGGRRGFMRFGSRGLRQRLLRRTWRPVLVTIPE